MINAAISLGVDIVFLALVLVFTNMGNLCSRTCDGGICTGYVCLK